MAALFGLRSSCFLGWCSRLVVWRALSGIEDFGEGVIFDCILLRGSAPETFEKRFGGNLAAFVKRFLTASLSPLPELVVSEDPDDNVDFDCVSASPEAFVSQFEGLRHALVEKLLFVSLSSPLVKFDVAEELEGTLDFSGFSNAAFSSISIVDILEFAFT